MHTAAARDGARRWTLEEMHALPERPGIKYELYYGELWVTPAPTDGHNTIIARLTHILVPYVDARGLGRVYHPRSVVRHRREVEVEPDLMVRQPNLDPDGAWKNAPLPSLVVEVVSRSSRRRDSGDKCDFYMKKEIPTYWIVDGDRRTFTVVEPGRDPVVVTETMTWMPAGTMEPLAFDVARVFG